MRFLRTYRDLEPIDWTASNTQTTAKNSIVIAKDGHAYACLQQSNRWTFHNAAGPQSLSGLDLWSAVRFLKSHQCRVIE